MNIRTQITSLGRSLLRGLGMPILASILAIVIGAIIAASVGFNPLVVYSSLLSGAFGSSVNIANTVAGAIPLTIVGLGLALAFRAGLFNIGAEGQYWVGVMVAVWLGYSVHISPGWLHSLICIIGAMLAGGLWGGVIPGLAKAFRGAHEVITTMMMSYIGIFLAKYMIENGPMREPGYIPQSKQIDANAWLSMIVQNTQLTTGVYIALVAVVVVWWLLFHTTFGFQIRTVGFNQRAARYAGMSVPLFTVLSLGLSGVLAGLAGAVQVLGLSHHLSEGFSTQYGFTAIVAALLARNNPFGVVLAALFFSALATGGQTMQVVSGVPASLTDVLTGLIIFFVAAEQMVPLTLSWYQRQKRRRSTSMIAKEAKAE